MLAFRNNLNQKFITVLIASLVGLLGFLGGIYYQKSTAPVPNTITTTTTKQSALPVEATVSRIIDGDTIELSTGQSVRLYGITAPEQNQPFYEEATNYTKQLTLDQQINLEYEQGYEQDKFGRLLAYVIIPNPPNSPNPLNLNIELSRQGLSEVIIYEKRRKLIYQDELLAAQAHAKGNKLGIWSK